MVRFTHKLSCSASGFWPSWQRILPAVWSGSHPFWHIQVGLATWKDRLYPTHLFSLPCLSRDFDFFRWTWVSQHQNVSILEVLELRMMEMVVTSWSYNTCKAPVRSSPPTNQNPTFLQAGCPSCRPTNNVKALKGIVQLTCNKCKSVRYSCSCAFSNMWI